jgi:hypothetical protein
MSKRGGTAPRPDKRESIFVPSRVPTSSSKYAMSQAPSASISIRGSSFGFQNPREPVRTSSNFHPEPSRPQEARQSPLLEEIEHVWEEGTKRPKTQNVKCRRTSTSIEAPSGPTQEVFPARHGNKVYDVPIIVMKDDRKRMGPAGKRTATAKYGQRGGNYTTALMSSLDKDFLDLFQM